MKQLSKLMNIIESIVFVSGNPILIKDIAEKLEITEKEVLDAAKELQKKYNGDCGLQLLIFNKKLQFASNPNYAEEVSIVLNPIKERELSRSMLEAAAIIAYKQPVTRMDLEEIRGNSEYAVQKLLELKVIEPVGRKDAVGKPILYGTTDEFLKRFQISSLDELPDYDELLEKIKLIRGTDDSTGYLYRKDEYVEESAVIEDKSDAPKQISMDDKPSDNGAKESVAATDIEDFELPPIEDEEIPDFLKDEDVDKV